MISARHIALAGLIIIEPPKPNLGLVINFAVIEIEATEIIALRLKIQMASLIIFGSELLGL